jgi:hypothetical protein
MSDNLTPVQETRFVELVYLVKAAQEAYRVILKTPHLQGSKSMSSTEIAQLREFRSVTFFQRPCLYA